MAGRQSGAASNRRGTTGASSASSAGRCRARVYRRRFRVRRRTRARAAWFRLNMGRWFRIELDDVRRVAGLDRTVAMDFHFNLLSLHCRFVTNHGGFVGVNNLFVRDLLDLDAVTIRLADRDRQRDVQFLLLREGMRWPHDIAMESSNVDRARVTLPVARRRIEI